jgi:hypothetical protein
MNTRAILGFVFCIPILSLLILLVMPSPLYYEQRPIRSSVIDNQGNKVAGAVVVATWLTEGGWFHVHGAGPLVEKQIAVTGTNGEFSLPGWGKRANQWGLNRRALQTYQPELIIYKFGYLPKKIINMSESAAQSVLAGPETGHSSTARSILTWQVEGPLVITKIAGDPADSYKTFSQNSGPIYQAMPSLFSGCEWKNFKPLLIEYDKQEQVAEELDLISRPIGTPILPWYVRAAEDFNLQFPDKKPDCPGLTEWLTLERLKRKSGVLRD